MKEKKYLTDDGRCTGLYPTNDEERKKICYLNLETQHLKLAIKQIKISLQNTFCMINGAKVLTNFHTRYFCGVKSIETVELKKIQDSGNWFIPNASDTKNRKPKK